VCAGPRQAQVPAAARFAQGASTALLGQGVAFASLRLSAVLIWSVSERSNWPRQIFSIQQLSKHSKFHETLIKKIQKWICPEVSGIVLSILT